MVTLARTLVPPARGRLAIALDGEHVVVQCGGELWLERRHPHRQTTLALAPGDAIAVTSGRVWTIRDGLLATHSLGAHLVPIELDVGPGAAIAAARGSIVASGPRGTSLVRDAGTTIELAAGPAFVRAIADHRYIVLVDGVPILLDVTAAPRALGLTISAPILDAAPILDRATFVLLLDRGGGAQELCVMRATGNALARIPVRHVAAVAASARSHLLALATDDGRVIVYDLRERRVVSADHVSDRAPAIALDPEGARLLGLADELFERSLVS